jgi:hypothetical protein
MSYRSKVMIQTLVDSRKQESIRIHSQYISAMELKNHNNDETKILKTILSDLPDEKRAVTHNVD